MLGSSSGGILDRKEHEAESRITQITTDGLLVWEERPLFAERIEAWANGPVVPDLYQRHKGQYEVSVIPSGDASQLDDGEAESVEVVLDYYGDWPAHELSELTHRERPWMAARKGLAPGERGSREITHDAMAEYYDGLTTENV